VEPNRGTRCLPSYSTLDPIIEWISGGTAGIPIAGQNSAVLAFADDMILIGKEAAIIQTSDNVT